MRRRVRWQMRRLSMARTASNERQCRRQTALRISGQELQSNCFRVQLFTGERLAPVPLLKPEKNGARPIFVHFDISTHDWIGALPGHLDTIENVSEQLATCGKRSALARQTPGVSSDV